MTFLVCVDDFFACVHIRFPFGFPQEPPLVELRSIYHLTQRTAYSERLKYPYDVSWSPKFMVERLCQTIYSYLQTFKFNSIKNCSGNQS